MRWFEGLGIGAGVYDAALAAATTVQRHFIYLPNRHKPEPDRAILPEIETVAYETADGLSLHAWYQPPRKASLPTLVYFHGNASHMGIRGPKLAPYLEAGYGGLLTSWRGFSRNPGNPHEQGLYHDGRAALGFLSRRGVNAENVILYGESLGTGVAVQLATESRPAAVILEAPYTSVPDIAQWRVPIAPVAPFIVDRFDSIAKIDRVSAPLLIVHGDHDMTIPIRFGRKLFDAANEPKHGVFIEGAGHTDLYDYGMAAIALDFLRTHGIG